MTKKTDLFDIKSSSDEASQELTIGAATYSIVVWQAIVGRLYAKAARFKRVTNKHQAWRKAANVRAKVNDALQRQLGEIDDIVPSS